jgi:hypothetical protein
VSSNKPLARHDVSDLSLKVAAVLEELTYMQYALDNGTDRDGQVQRVRTFEKRVNNLHVKALDILHDMVK